MDPTSLWFLLFMVLAGGTVAWYGDTLGSKLGKKRLTLFKLRPRKFAAMMTFIFGALGTLLTILILFSFSEPIRTWILEGNAARDRLAQTRGQLDAAEIKLTEANSRLATVEPKLTELGQEVTAKTNELITVKTQQQLLADKNANLGNRARELSGRIGNLTSQFKSVNLQLNKVQTERKQLDQQIKVAQGEKGRLTGDNADIQNENFRLTQEALKLERGLRDIQKELESVGNEYDQLKAASRQAEASFNERLTKFQTDLANADRELRQVRNSLASEKAALERFRLDTPNLLLKSAISRKNAMIYAVGDEVSRSLAPSGMSLPESRDFVAKFMRDTRNQADLRGAGKTEEGEYAGLVIAALQGKPVSPEDQQLALIQNLAGLTRPKVVRAIASLNTFQDEFVPIAIEAYDNVLAFEANEVIFTIQVDGRKSYGEIAETINKALENDLPEVLVKNNVIPATGSARPFGELDTDRIFEIILEVKEYGRPARIQFLAAKDIYSVDKVSVTYRLRP